jgi:hypothetical protein
MFQVLFVFLAAAALLFTVSCGSDDSLGSVGDHTITTEEYLAVFNALPASEQVDVLSPGGRMALMDRIVRKRLLLAAWEEDPSVSLGWEDIYRVSLLADSMLYRLASEYDHQAYLDSVSSLGYASFALRTVLLADSSQAEETAAAWNGGDYSRIHSSIGAPWGTPDGGSYRTMGGPLHMLAHSFVPLLEMEHGAAHVLPMFGAWAVCALDLVPGEWQPDEAAASSGFMAHVAAAVEETVLASGIAAVADGCHLAGTVLVPGADNDTTIVAVLPDGVMTAGEIMALMNMMNPSNFAGPVPEELSALIVPQVETSTELTLWFYVSSVVRRHALAALALESGVVLPESALDYARAESVIRDRLLNATASDSSFILQWYLDNSEGLMYPERRSVLLGYTDSTLAASATPGQDFLDLPRLETMVSPSGEMVPTPLQPLDVFGPVLGAAIFEADTGYIAGPVYTGGELAAWFKVVEIAPPSLIPLEEVYDQVATQAARSCFEEGFAALMAELENSYSVSVDTQAVERIDLWGSMR